MGIRCIRNFCLRSEEVARHATDGQPDGDETDEEDGEEGEKEVGGLNADGVGIDDKGAFAGTQGAQGGHVLLLLNHQHGEGADDVEGGHEEDEGQEEVSNELLDLHNAKGVLLLFVAVDRLLALIGPSLTPPWGGGPQVL